MEILSDFSKRQKSINFLYRSTELVLAVTIFVLLIPFIAMQISDEVMWSSADFIVAGTLIFSIGLTFKLISQKINNSFYKAALGLTLFLILAIIWINLAVGFIGSEHNPANLMYLVVLAVVLIGSIIIKFKPIGMSNVLLINALMHSLVTIIAFFSLIGEQNINQIEILITNGFFIILWLSAAWLFRKSVT